MTLYTFSDALDLLEYATMHNSYVFGDVRPTRMQLGRALAAYMDREPIYNWATNIGPGDLVLRKVARGFRIEPHPTVNRLSTELAPLSGMRMPWRLTRGIRFSEMAPLGSTTMALDNWLQRKIAQDFAGKFRYNASVQHFSNYYNPAGYIQVLNSDNVWDDYLYIGTVRGSGITYVTNELRYALPQMVQHVPPRRAMEFDYSDKREKKPVRSGTGNINQWFADNEGAKTSERIIEKFPIAEHGTQSSRRWGIEVEAAGARNATTPAHWERKHDSSLHSAYRDEDGELQSEPEFPDLVRQHQNDYLHNVTIYDGAPSYTHTANANYIPMEDCEECMEYERAYEEWESGVNDYYGNGYESEDDTGEFVSPPLRSFHSRGLEGLIADLQNEPQNDSAGIHVHVEVDDLSPKQIASLLYGYNKIEPLLVASYQRETREYCKQWDAQLFRRAMRSAKTVSNRNDIDYGDRYVSLNLLAMRYHNTIEFRAMGPVYNYEYLIKWAMFCREMVNLAKANTRPSEWNRVKDFNSLRSLMLRKGTELVNVELGQFRDIKLTAPAGVQIGRREREEAEENVTVYDEPVVNGAITFFDYPQTYSSNINLAVNRFERLSGIIQNGIIQNASRDVDTIITYDVVN